MRANLLAVSLISLLSTHFSHAVDWGRKITEHSISDAQKVFAQAQNPTVKDLRHHRPWWCVQLDGYELNYFKLKFDLVSETHLRNLKNPDDSVDDLKLTHIGWSGKGPNQTWYPRTVYFRKNDDGLILEYVFDRQFDSIGPYRLGAIRSVSDPDSWTNSYAICSLDAKVIKKTKVKSKRYRSTNKAIEKAFEILGEDFPKASEPDHVEDIPQEQVFEEPFQFIEKMPEFPNSEETNNS